MLADHVRWRQAWQRAGYQHVPWPRITHGWPVLRGEFRAPARWSSFDLERAGNRIAVAAKAPWHEIHPLADGRWALLLDATDWSKSVASPAAVPYEDRLVVPIGEHPDGRAEWDLRRSPHALVAGPTGSGKSTLLRTILAGLPTGWPWRVVIVDPKQTDFRALRNDVTVVGLADAPAVLTSLVADLQAAKARLAAADALNWLDLPERIVPYRPVFLVVDEAVDLLTGADMTKLEAAGVKGAIGQLARQGRACGFHVLLGFTRPDVDAIPGAIRDQLGARIALGNLSPDGTRMVLGSSRVPRLPQALPGTGLCTGLDGSPLVRRLRVPQVSLDAVRARHRTDGVFQPPTG